MNMLQKGNKHRTVEATAANATSSRSHALLQVNVNRRSKLKDVKGKIKSGRLFMIDLAGSERASQTKVSHVLSRMFCTKILFCKFAHCQIAPHWKYFPICQHKFHFIKKNVCIFQKSRFSVIAKNDYCSIWDIVSSIGPKFNLKFFLESWHYGLYENILFYAIVSE